MFRKALFIAVLILATAVGVIASAQATAPPDHKVTLCHLADGPAQAGLITVDVAAAYHGHYLQHAADVIPPFEYQGETYSLNWTGEFPEECGGGTTTEPPGTTTEPPPTTTDENPPPNPCPEHIISDRSGVIIGVVKRCEPNPPDKFPHYDREECPPGQSPWKGACYPDDAQKQPNGSVVYGEQG